MKPSATTLTQSMEEIAGLAVEVPAMEKVLPCDMMTFFIIFIFIEMMMIIKNMMNYCNIKVWWATGRASQAAETARCPTVGEHHDDNDDDNDNDNDNDNDDDNDDHYANDDDHHDWQVWVLSVGLWEHVPEQHSPVPGNGAGWHT